MLVAGKMYVKPSTKSPLLRMILIVRAQKVGFGQDGDLRRVFEKQNHVVLLSTYKIHNYMPIMFPFENNQTLSRS